MRVGNGHDGTGKRVGVRRARSDANMGSDDVGNGATVTAAQCVTEGRHTTEATVPTVAGGGRSDDDDIAPVHRRPRGQRAHTRAAAVTLSQRRTEGLPPTATARNRGRRVVRSQVENASLGHDQGGN